MTTLLEVRNLRTVFSSHQGDIAVVNGISFDVKAGHTLAIVGESGCGKSVTSLSIMGLLPKPAGRIAGGSIRFEGRELVGATEQALQDLRGNGMAMLCIDGGSLPPPSRNVLRQCHVRRRGRIEKP